MWENRRVRIVANLNVRLSQVCICICANANRFAFVFVQMQTRRQIHYTHTHNVHTNTHTHTYKREHILEHTHASHQPTHIHTRTPQRYTRKQVWDYKVKNVKDIGDHGDIEHLRAPMIAKGARHIRLKANDLCWCEVMCVCCFVLFDPNWRLDYRYRVIPAHRNWLIETAVWNLAGFWHYL